MVEVILLSQNLVISTFCALYYIYIYEQFKYLSSEYICYFTEIKSFYIIKCFIEFWEEKRVTLSNFLIFSIQCLWQLKNIFLLYLVKCLKLRLQNKFVKNPKADEGRTVKEDVT